VGSWVQVGPAKPAKFGIRSHRAEAVGADRGHVDNSFLFMRFKLDF